MASLISCEPSRRTPNSATAGTPGAAAGLRPRSSISLLADQLKLSSLDERPPVKSGLHDDDDVNAGLSKFPPPSGAFILPCPIPVSRISEDLTTGVLVHPHDVFSSSVPYTCSPHCSRPNSDQEDENADPIPRPNDSREERSSLFQHSKRACRSLSASSSVHQHSNRPHHQVHKVNRTNCPTNQFEAHMSTLPRPIAIRPTPRYSEKSPGACSLNLAAVPLRPRPREINYLSRLSWHHPLFTSGIGAKAQHPSYGVHFACALPNCMTITTAASCLPQQQQQQQQRVSGAEQRSTGATACTSSGNGRPMVGHQSLNVCHRHQSSLSLRTQAAHSCTESELSTSSGVASVCGHSSAFTPTHTGFGSPQNATQSSDCSLSPDIDSASSSVQFPVPTPSSGFHESSFPWLSEAFSLPDCSRDMEALTMEEKSKKRKTKRENFPFLASSVTNEFECSPNDNSLANKFQSELTDCAIRCRSQPNGVTQPEEEEDDEEEGEVVDSSNPRTRCPPRISSGNFLTGLKRRRGSGNGDAVPTSLTSSVATSPAYRWQSGGNPSGFRTSFPQVDNTQYDFGSSLPQDRISSNQFADVFFFGSGSGMKSGSDLAGDDDLSSLAQVTLMSGENKSTALSTQTEMSYCPCAVCESASIRVRSGPTDLIGTVPPTSTDGLSDVQYWHSLVAHSMTNPRVGLDSDGIPCRHVCAQLGDLCESMEEEKDYETPETMTEEAGSVSDSSWKRSNHPVIKSPSVHDITFAPIHSQPDESEASDLERDENDDRRLNSTNSKGVDSTNSHNPTTELQSSTNCVGQEGDEQLVLFSSSESEDSDPDAIVSPQLVNRHVSNSNANANNCLLEQTNSSRPDIDLELIEND
ncbi:unnamed protein product [Calicophoron daubneyi]|uniref:Uncharacterized protein n=1 Tax=Calicophoron daubneyi TaxID=300641 RepID=A0AAV2TI65_CALDB